MDRYLVLAHELGFGLVHSLNLEKGEHELAHELAPLVVTLDFTLSFVVFINHK
jgi:hypothetical protein